MDKLFLFKVELEKSFYETHTEEVYGYLRGYTPESTIKNIQDELEIAHLEDDERKEELLWAYLKEYTTEVYLPWKKEQKRQQLFKKIKEGQETFWGDHAIGYPLKEGDEVKYLVDFFWDDFLSERVVSEEEFIELFL